MKRTDFNHGWRCNGAAVTLPHDAMIRKERTAGAPGGSAQAYFPGGEYVYEKRFERPGAGHVLFQFEGVYRNARVWINGHEAGGTEYGYLPFLINADPYLTEGENIIRVECENKNQPDSRWYTGAGIYRPVWMWTGAGESIEPEAVRIRTLSTEPARIQVTVECAGEPLVQIRDGEAVVVQGRGRNVELEVPEAKFWSEESPYLYTCVAALERDESETAFGIRTIAWDNKGFYINGKPTLLRGGCLHHDNGIVGAATYDESEWRRVRMLKEAGFNAIRSAHNPASRALLEACDYYGLYVMDESWDMWFHHKSRYDYAGCWKKNYLKDLQTMVNRDFNHPSVVMYSIGNEVSEPAKEDGLKKVREMVDFLKDTDGTRPVTGGFNLMILSKARKGKGIYNEEGGRDESADQKMQGMNSTMFNFITNLVGTGMNKSANSKAADKATALCLDMLDMAGYNYASGRYPMEGKCHPERIIFGSETFPQDIAKNWAMVERYPYLVGDFMWTAWDYIGEAGLGAWAYTNDGTGFNKPYPWLLADTGAFDIVGTPNGELFLAQAAWGVTQKPVIGVQPVNHSGRKPAKMAWRGTNALNSWSWRGCEGNKAVVEVFSNAAVIELLVNGKSLGKKKVKGCKAVFKTRYEAGKVEAIAYDASGNRISDNSMVSAIGKVCVSAVAETDRAIPGEVVYIHVALTGENGIVESNADEKLTVRVEGGEFLGFGSANPRTEERFGAASYTSYYGIALAAVRVGPSGCTKVIVSGMESGTDTVEILIRK